MGLPKLSHLQFLVLGILLNKGLRGRDIRERLREFEVRMSGPGFYQLMARLEDANFVRGRYEQEIVKGQIIRERCYKIRASGIAAWNECRDFQAAVIEELGGVTGFVCV